MRRCKAEVPPSHVWLVEGVPKKNQSYWTYKPIYKPLLLKLQAQLIVNDSFIIRFDFWLNISYHTMLIFAMMLLVITSKSIYIYTHSIYVPVLFRFNIMASFTMRLSKLFFSPVLSRRRGRRDVLSFAGSADDVPLRLCLRLFVRHAGARWLGMVKGWLGPRTKGWLGDVFVEIFYMI